MQPSFWAGKHVCVTGGTGFLGSHLVAQLVELGARVRVLALRPARYHPILNHSRVEKQFGDILSPAVVRQALADCQVVFHTAGILTAWGAVAAQMYSIHSTGTRMVLEGARPGNTARTVPAPTLRPPAPRWAGPGLNDTLAPRVDHAIATLRAEHPP